tara:strand:+ start:10906 stop:11463 length:558 start_codon:yes stop_codon:yes gene_type:complete
MEHYIKIKTSKGIIFKKINVINEEEFITKEEEQKQIDNSNDYEMKKPAVKKAPAKKTAEPESLLDDEEREMVEAQIKKQQEKLESGKFHVVDRDTNSGTAKAMKVSNPFDDNNYNDDDIYKELGGRYHNIFSHMNKLWCDNEGFEDCSKCSLYARMLVKVFDKINELSGRDMSKDLCTYHKDDVK